MSGRISAGLAVVAALLAAGCREKDDDEQEHSVRSRVDERGRVVLSEPERKALGLEIVTAAQGVLTTSALRFGRVIARPADEAWVTAPVTGRLLAPPLTLGGKVSAGDVVATLEPLVDTASRATLDAQRRELQGQLAGGRAQVEAKRTELSRVSSLQSSGLATAADKAQAEAALTAEQAQVEGLRRAGSELARGTGGRLELRAPLAGVVALLASEPGTIIQQGSVLARIVRPGPRWIDVTVPPGDAVGSAYRAEGPWGVAVAKLSSRGAVIESDGTRRDRIEADEEASANLLPGATVAVEVLHETPGVLVPANALVRSGRQTLAFVEADAGRYERRPVQLAARDELRAAVASGLAAGERIVSQGAASLLGELGAEGGAEGGTEGEGTAE